MLDFLITTVMCGGVLIFLGITAKYAIQKMESNYLKETKESKNEGVDI